MTDDIQPALSPEEWKTQRIDFPELAATGGMGESIIIQRNPVGLLVSRDCVVPPSKQHALAALCLYGQPFGFTQRDVDEMSDLAACWEEEATWSDEAGGHSAYRAELTNKGVWGKNAESCRRRAAIARSLASRIASLLPPPPPAVGPG